MRNIVQLIDTFTKESVNYEEVILWHDGTVMTDSKVDNVIYRKKGSRYYKRILIDNTIDIRWFGAVGNANYHDITSKRFYVDPSKLILATNDIDAIQRACSLPFDVYFPEGNYLIEASAADPNKRYISLKGGHKYFGDGKRKSIIIQNITNVLTGEGGWGQFYIDSGDEANFIENTIISDLAFDGVNYIWGKQQWTHTLALAGTKNTLIENCGFYNFRGDGLNISAAPKYDLAPDGATYAYARHNFDVTVRKCEFDGGFVKNTIKENRTGLAIIDCDGVVVDDCVFSNIGRTYDPDAGDGGFGLGAIDIERDKSDLSKTRNVKIINSRFVNIADTNQGAITLINGDARDGWTDSLIIKNNNFYNCNYGVQAGMGRAWKYASIYSDNIIIEGNIFRKCQSAIIASGKGIKILNNLFAGESTWYSFVNLGNIETGHFVKDLAFENNTFIGAAGNTTAKVLIKHLEDAIFKNNKNYSAYPLLGFLSKGDFTLQRFENIDIIGNVSNGALFTFTTGSTTNYNFFCSTIRSINNISNTYFRTSAGYSGRASGETGLLFSGELILSGNPNKGTWYQGSELFYHHSIADKYKRVCTRSGTYGGPNITTGVTIVLNQNYVEIADADTLGFLVGMIVEVSNNIHPVLRTKITQITSSRIYFDHLFQYGPSANSIKTATPTWVDVAG